MLCLVGGAEISVSHGLADCGRTAETQEVQETAEEQETVVTLETQEAPEKPESGPDSKRAKGSQA